MSFLQEYKSFVNLPFKKELIVLWLSIYPMKDLQMLLMESWEFYKAIWPIKNHFSLTFQNIVYP